jgi:drug/metabolite transporter (DMT)-like permease
VTPRRRDGLVLALAAALVSGVAVYVNGLAVRHFPSPTVYTTGKNLVAGSILLAAAVAHRRWTDRWAMPPTTARSHPGALAAVALIGGAVPFVLFFEGLASASSTDAAFIHKTLIVWAVILAVVVLGERIGAVHLIAIALLVLGHAALAGGVGALRIGTGELMILAATLCWAVELIIVKRLLSDLAPTTIAAVRLGGGSAVLLIWVVASGAASELTGLTAAQWSWLALTGPILATFVTVWFAALARARVIDVTAVLVLGAVVTGLIAVVFDGGEIGGRLTGDGLILAGVILVFVAASGQRRPAAGERGALRWT